MNKKYLVSAEKFKKLYFYKFLLIQIWFGISLIEMNTMVFILSKDLARSLIYSYITCILSVPIGISLVLWLFSLTWYNDKINMRRNAYIMKNDTNFIFYTVKESPISNSSIRRYNCYTYTIKDISSIKKDKYNVTIYGNITMEKRSLSYPKDIIRAKQYSHIKIPNVFSDIDPIFIKEKPNIAKEL